MDDGELEMARSHDECRLWVRAMVGERQEAACWARAQKRLHVCFVVVWWGHGVILRI